MNELVVNGLVRKRSELAGEIEHTQARLRTMMADVGSLDAAIRVFNPEYKVDGIKAMRFQGRKQTNRGERSRAIFDVLRAASGPLTTREVAAGVAPGVDAVEIKSVVKRVGLALSRQREKGVVKGEKSGNGELVWSLFS